MASIPTVQRGTKTFGASATLTIVRGTDSGFDTTVDTSKTILRVTVRTTEVTIARMMCSWTLTDGDTITVTRGSATGTPIVEWELISFATGVVTQYETVTFGTGNTVATSAISAASLGGGRWIIPCGQSLSGGGTLSQYPVRWLIDSSTQISANRGLTGGATVASCIVVEYDDATVEVVSHTLSSSTDLTVNKTLTTPVSLTGAAVWAGVSDGTGLTSINDLSWVAHLTATDTLTFVRGVGTSMSGTLLAYVVSFNDSTLVQRLTMAQANTVGTTSSTLSPAVTTARTMTALNGAFMPQFGSSADAAAIDRMLATIALTSTTNADTIRADANNATTFYGQAIEFNGPAAGPTIDTQPQADVVLINGDATRASAAYSVTATGTGTLTYQWQLEDSVGAGTYTNIASGSGATWSGGTSATLTGTFTAKTITGRKVRCNVTDDNGTTTTNAVLLTVYTGPVLSKSSGTTNASGVDTLTITSDYPNGVGEFTVTTATARGITKTVSQVFTA